MSIYEKNLTQFKKIYPEFTKEITASKAPKWFSCEGKDNFTITQGEKVHRAYDIENRDEVIEGLKKNKLLRDDITVYIGIGDGKILIEALKVKEDKHIILVIEPVLFFIDNFMDRYDITKYLKNGGIIFSGTDNKQISAIFGTLEAAMVIQNWFMISEAYVIHLKEIYGDIIGYTTSVINQMQCNIGTVMGAGQTIAENDIKNLPYIIRHRGVSEIKDLFKDKPAVIVSTGPSLQKNIHILKENQKKVVIIAVAQALRVLLAYDIRPDFICTVDYGAVNLEHFEGLMDEDIPLVALNRSYAPILKRWKGPKFITVSHTDGFPGTAINYIQEKGSILQGGSVSHLCIGLAIHLGCNPIAITGQDLAYEGSNSHIPLVDAGGKLEVKDGQLQWDVNDPKSSLHGKPSSMGAPLYVPGYFIDPVMTNIGLKSFITAFENIFADYKDNKFYNCTEGGASLKGSEQLSLRKYIKKNGASIKKNKIEPFLSLVDNYMEKIGDIIPLLENEINDLYGIQDKARLALSVNKKMAKKSNRRNEKTMKLLLSENEKHSKDAENLAKHSPLMGIHIYKESREIQSRELKVNGKTNHILKNKKDFKTRINRNEIILTAARNSAKKLRDMYQEALDILKEYHKEKDESLLCSPNLEIVEFSNASDYIKSGNWANPLVAINKLIMKKKIGLFPEFPDRIKDDCEKMRNDSIELAIYKYDEREKLIDYNNLIETSRNAGREDRDFKLSMKYLKQAKKLLPEKYEARWGLATAYHHCKDIKKSAAEYETLIADFPKNNRLKFEYGLVLLQFDVSKAFGIMREMMDGTTEFDHYLSKLGDLYKENGKIQEAINCYERYLKKYPANTQIEFKLKELKK